MKQNLKQRQLQFFVQDGCLVRTVTGHGSDGRSYTQRCRLQTFEAVAHAFDEMDAEGEGTTMMLLAEKEQLPCTQVNIALEFLKERGIVEVRHRRCYRSSISVHLDAMTEWHALAAASTVVV